MRRGPIATSALAALGVSAIAAAAPPAADERPAPPPTVAAFAPQLGFALSGGAVMPSCDSQGGACAAGLPVSPAFTGLVLFEPNRFWAVGLMQGLARVSWLTRIYPSAQDAALRTVDAELTTAFVALVSRVTLRPRWPVAPIVQVALGDSFQWEAGAALSCDAELNPTGQVGLGARLEVPPRWSLFVLATATDGLRGGGCGGANNPRVAPFAAWGYGLQLGIAYDQPLRSSNGGTAP
jgi:hypothetical protein